MKCFFTLFLVCGLLSAGYAQTNVNGGIYTNTTWTKTNSPYIVTDTVVVFPNVTLTIEPGVVVKFDDDKRLEIRYAKLVAEGTSTDSITFTSNSANPHPGSWSDIWLNQDTSSKFKYCNFYYANIAVNQYVTHNMLYKNCVFSNNNTGIGGSHPNTGLNVVLDSCLFSNNTQFGISEVHGSISNCNFFYNPVAIDDNFGSGNLYLWCTISHSNTGVLNITEALVSNCTIRNNSTGIKSRGYNTILNSNIDSNSVVGIDCDGSDTVSNCRIVNNNKGLDLFVRSTIRENIIEDNTIGIWVGSTNNNVYCNRICNNSLYNLYYGVTGNNSSFGSNYWCSTDSASIAATVMDGYDNINLSLAGFVPFDTTQCYQQHCSAYFALYPDINLLHTYNIINMAYGTGELSYLWNWGDGGVDTVAYPSHTYSSAGLYTICLTITDSVGCSNYYCSNFSLQRTTNTIIQVNVVPGVNTGISDFTVSNPSFQVFPNPTSDLFTIATDKSFINSTVTITDLTGRKVAETQLAASTTQLSTENMPDGVYFITLINNGVAHTQKLIIQK